MFSLRPAIRVVCSRHGLAVARPMQALGGWQHQQQQHLPFSSKGVVEQGDEDEEDALAPIEKKREELSERGNHLVWESPDQLPAPRLPDNPAEIAALDPADSIARFKGDGSIRTVMIRQEKANVKQSPLNPEKKWKISFVEDGTAAEKWENSLMGWTSNADSYQSQPPLFFENASDAVYFAKKRGWQFVVKEPIMRTMRSDGAQYQDNFLPQAVAAKIQKEGKQCDHWKREAAATSHYFRPLRYHGKGVVDQHGPNGGEKIAPHVEGIYKLR